MPLIHPLAAGGVDVFFTILFAVISIGAAIVNAINSKKEPPRKVAGGRPKDQKVRQEIDEFLQQQGGRKSRPVEVSPDDIELVEETPRRRPNPVVRPTKTPKSSQKQAAPPRTKASPPAPQPAQRASALPTKVSKRGDAPQGSQTLGSEIRDHVSSAMAERVVAQAERDLPHLSSSVDQKVREDLGVFSVSGKSDTVSSGSSPLMSMLQNPKTARQAFLMSEIMGRPKALRK